MKKINFVKTLFLVVASMMMFTSCQKDPEDLLIGKWKIVESDDGYINALGEVEYSEHNSDEIIGATLTFKEDGKVDVFGDGEFITWSWSYADDVILLNVDDELIRMEILEIDKKVMHTYTKTDVDEDGYGYSDWHLEKVE